MPSSVMQAVRSTPGAGASRGVHSWPLSPATSQRPVERAFSAPSAAHAVSSGCGASASSMRTATPTTGCVAAGACAVVVAGAVVVGAVAVGAVVVGAVVVCGAAVGAGVVGNWPVGFNT